MENRFLEKESIAKLLIKYSLPAIVGMLVVALYNAVDRMFIGHIENIGYLAITGVGVTMPISTVIIAFEMLVGIGSSAVISKRLGEGKYNLAEKQLGNAFTLAIIIGLLITFTGFIFKNSLLILFGASSETLPYASEYIDIILIGVTPYILGFSLNTTIRANGNPRLAAVTLIVSCIANIILDPLFIFTFNMGIKGAAIATVISQCIVTVWVLIYYTVGKSNVKLKKRNFRLNIDLVKPVFFIGASAFAMQIATSIVQIAANNTLKLYGGDLAIGAMTTINSIVMLFLMAVFGINQGMLPIIGFNYGAKKYDRVRKTYILGTLGAIFILIIGWVLSFTFPKILVSFFNKDEDLINIAINGLKLYVIMLPISAISITGGNYFLSIGEAKSSMFLSLLRQVIIFIPLLFILPRFLGLNGVWISQAISDGLASIISLVFMYNEFKNLKLKG